MNQTIGVNITPQSFQPTLHFSQGDVGRVFVEKRACNILMQEKSLL